jgi:hypothetical protein
VSLSPRCALGVTVQSRHVLTGSVVLAVICSMSAGASAAIHQEADATTRGVAAVSASGKAGSFTVAAPTKVRTRDRFTISAQLPRSFAGGVAVASFRQGNTWVPLTTGKVGSKGRLNMKVQLSQAGSYRMQVHVTSSRARSKAQSKSFVVMSTGPKSAAEVSGRLLAHAASETTRDANAATRARTPRTADAADAATAAAGATTEAAEGVDAVAKGAFEWTADAAGVGAVAFGVNALLELIFPGTATSTAAQIEQLQEEVEQGFENVYIDLQQLQSTLDYVAAQNSQTFAEAALADCQAALDGIQADVVTIQDTFDNYQDVLTTTWSQQNLSVTGGTANAVAIGNYVFGIGANATPSFGPGINAVQAATSDIESAFTNTGPLGILTTCADAMAGYTIQQQVAAKSNVTTQVPVGELDTFYFEQMQSLAGEYASIINIGAGLAGVGNLLAAATEVSSNVETVAAFISACQGLDEFSCPETAQELQQSSQSVTTVWNLVGASWGQVTNEFLKSDLYATSGSNVFSNGANAWLTDISTFQSGTFGASLIPGPAVNSSYPVIRQDFWGAGYEWVDAEGVSMSAQYMSTAQRNGNDYSMSFIDSAWGPLVFDPASSEDWNNILRTSYYTAAYPGAQGPILEQCGVDTGSSNTLTSCNDGWVAGGPYTYGQVGQYMGWAGLNNGGQPVSQDDNLIVYTGETYEWDPYYSALSAGFCVGGENCKATSPSNWVSTNGISNLQVATFLDTGMLPNLGVSAMINDPGGFDFASQDGDVGDLTLGDVFPFATTVEQITPTELSVTLQNYSAGYNYVALPCSDWTTAEYVSNGGGNWTIMNWIAPTGAPANGSSTQYGSGCGWTSYYPKGGAPQTSSSTTQFSTSQLVNFYAQPQIYVTDNGEPCNGGASKCNTSYPGGWNSVPQFVLGMPGTPGGDAPASEIGVAQPMWPVVETATSNLSEVCPRFASGSNVTAFTQGATSIGVPQTCNSLFQEWLAVAAGQDIGPVTIQALPQTGQPGGLYAAQVGFANSSASPVTMSAVFGAADGATVSAPPTASVVNSCQSITQGAMSGYSCEVTLPPGASVVSVPVTFSSSSTSKDGTGAFFAGAASKTSEYVAGYRTEINTNPTIPVGLPAGVTGLSATFDTTDPVTASGGGEVTLSWNVPYSSSPITNYLVTGTGPVGATPINATVPVAQVTPQPNGQVSYQVDISQSGLWTFTVAAQSSAGAGPDDIDTVSIGYAPPPAPRMVTGRELAGGQVAVAWQPSVSSPPVDLYTVTWWSGTSVTPPPNVPVLVPGQDWVVSGSGASTVGVATVPIARYFSPPIPTTGPWTFQVTAVNAVGASQPSTVTVPIVGTLPSRPLSLEGSIQTNGVINAQWTASPFGVPSPTSYTVGLYGPTTCTQDDSCTTPLLASSAIAAIDVRGPMSISDMFQLGTDSTPGTYTFVVYAVNEFGQGATIRDADFVTSAFISRLSSRQTAIEKAKTGIAATIEKLNSFECSKGLLSGSACTSP